MASYSAISMIATTILKTARYPPCTHQNTTGHDSMKKALSQLAYSEGGEPFCFCELIAE